MKNAIFTIVAKNYMASALSLKESARRFHPEVDFYIILADRWESDEQKEKAGKDIMVADKEVVPQIERMSFIYDVVEFSTAIKPFYFRYLLMVKDYDNVIYLDPDTWIMDSLDELWDSLEGKSIVLTPHIVDISKPSDYHKESHILNRGVYNLGFIGVSNREESIAYLDWWAKQLETECIRSETRFVDQKWAEYIPIFVSNYNVNKSKVYNISDWNYHERSLRCEDVKYQVLDIDNEWRNIRFFHFSGIKMQSAIDYVNAQHTMLDEKTKDALLKLVPVYQEELKKHGYDYWSKRPYSFNCFENGSPILLIHRRLARSLYVEKNKVYDDLFSADDNSYYALLKKNKMVLKASKVSSDAAIATGKTSRDSTQGKGRMRSIIRNIIYKYIKHKGIRRYEKMIMTMHNNSDIDQQWRWLGNNL